jgi:HlyD family secretion protein
MMAAFLKRWRWALLLALLLAGGLTYAFWPQPQPVDAAAVTRGAMMVGITDDGTTRVRRLSVVSAPISGYVEPILLEPGDGVQAGRMITHMHGPPSAPLDPSSQRQVRAALVAAQASTRGTAATLEQARRDLARAEDLGKRGFLARAQLEAARTRVATAAALLAQGNADIARLRAQLADPTGSEGSAEVPVRAPASGTVLSVLRQGDAIVPEGTELMTIGNPADIEVVVDLLSRDAVKVQPGAAVQISQWGGDTPLIGTVKRIEPLGRLKVSALGIEEQRVNIIIGFDAGMAGKAARLGHGFQLDATVVLWQAPAALRVPIGALFRGPDGGWRVFVINAGRARAQAVTIGHINDEFGEVLAGLSEGQSVVLNPGSLVADGGRVKAR